MDHEKELIDLYYRHIGNGYFLNALENYTISTGFGLENIGCVFAEELKEWEDDYFGDTGVAFYFEIQIVDNIVSININLYNLY